MKHKSLRTLCAVAMLLAAGTLMAQTPALPKIFGSVIFGLKWEQMQTPPYGVYSISPGKAYAVDAVALDNQLKVNGGGTYADGLYYTISYSDDDVVRGATMRVFDVADNFKKVRQVEHLPAQSVVTDLTYDPQNDVIYGVFWSHDDVYFLGTLDQLTGITTEIGQLSEKLITLASDKDGNLFGVGEYGTLYKVDRFTAGLTAIGSTGKTIRYAQSATFDFASGRLLWVMTPHDFAKDVELCQIDTLTGKVLTLSTIANRYEFTGIYTTSTFTAEKAPARPSGMKINFPKGSLSGELNFTLPTTTFGGQTLSEPLAYVVMVDADTIDSMPNGVSGQALSYNLSFTPGYHKIVAWATNNAGRSPLLKTYYWAGPDRATAQEVEAAVAADGMVDIKWKQPSVGVHGGYIDTSNLSYKVLRQPGAQTVYEGKGETCRDSQAAAQKYGVYHYDIVTYTGVTANDTASTAPITLGQAATLPYSNTFDNQDDVKTLAVIDNNGDGNSWMFFGNCMIYPFSQAGYDGDDWLVSPPFDLKKNYVYRLSFDTKADDGYPEVLAAAWGKELSSEAFTHEIMPATQIADTTYRRHNILFAPGQDTPAYIGLHALSKADEGCTLYIDNLSVEQVAEVQAPDSVTALKAVPSAKGEKRVDLSFYAPKTSINGIPITQPMTISVTDEAHHRLVATLKNVQPGKACFVSDSVAATGYNAYAVVAANSHGGGMPAFVNAFTGQDTPGAVTVIGMSATDDGHVKLWWKAPEKGANGGWIDPAKLTYVVTNLDGQQGKSTTVAQPEYAEQLTMQSGKQRLAWYEVKAVNDMGEGPTVNTDTLFVGPPYELPLKESFAARGLQTAPWNVSNTNVAEWMVLGMGTYADPADNDGGLAAFTTITPGARAKLIGPKFEITGTANPHLTFSLWHSPACSAAVEVALKGSDGHNYSLGRFDASQNVEGLEGTAGFWTEHTIDLTPYVHLPFVQLVFTGIGGAANGEWNVPLYLDNIRLYNYLSEDLAMNPMLASKDKVEVGQEIGFTVSCTNKGQTAAENYSVLLYRGDEQMAMLPGKRVEPGATAMYSFVHTPNGDAPETSLYHAVIEWKGDENVANNYSDTIAVTVEPGKPYVNDVRAYAEDNNVVLEWSKPQGIDRDTKVETITEGFENYLPFTIKHFGAWTLTDGDGQPTLGIQDGTGNFVQYPNVEAPMAYMAFNPGKAGLSPMYFKAHTGSQVAAAFSAGRTTANDDWLVSPLVDGAQTISFFACSPDNDYYGTQETLEVLYSSTGTNVADFKRIGSPITVPGTWTQYKVDLPQGARHFALRCTSKDQYILFVDDVVYRKAARNFRLLGYNVYRDSILLTSSPVAATQYVDKEGANGTHVYTVTAVYNEGESVASPGVSTGSVGIGTIDAQSIWSVSVAGGTIRIKAPSTQLVGVYAADGRRIGGGKGSWAIPVPPGVYIVKGGNKTVKVVCRQQ